MTRRLTKPAQDVKNSRHISRPVWIIRMAGDGDESIFGDRTGCPGFLTLFHEPSMRGWMMDVHRVRQRQEQIDIQKIDGHGASSRRRLTRSRVTTPASGRTGNSGSPCLVHTGARRVNACRDPITPGQACCLVVLQFPWPRGGHLLQDRLSYAWLTPTTDKPNSKFEA